MKEVKELIDVKQVRKDFPMLNYKMNGRQIVYFDSAASLFKPQTTIDRLSEFYSKEYGKENAKYDLGKQAKESLQEVRQKAADLINAGKDEVVFVKNATEAINIVALAFEREHLKKGDEVLITIAEHHSNLVPWQIACAQTGATLKYVPVTNTGELDMEAFEELLTEKVKIFSIAHSSNVLGTVFPIKKLVKAAHAKNIPVFVDGAQTAPHMPVDVKDLGCDFFAFSAHKMGGPTGVGVLYGKKEWLNKLMPAQFGDHMTKKVSADKTTFESIPEKFEAGTTPLAEIIAFGATIDYANTLGTENIEKYEKELLYYATDKLDKLDRVNIIGRAEEKEPLISFTLDKADLEKANEYFNQQGIALKVGNLEAEPLFKFLKVEQALRISFAYFNTFEEIDYFTGHLEKFLKKH